MDKTKAKEIMDVFCKEVKTKSEELWNADKEKNRRLFAYGKRYSKVMKRGNKYRVKLYNVEETFEEDFKMEIERLVTKDEVNISFETKLKVFERFVEAKLFGDTGVHSFYVYINLK